MKNVEDIYPLTPMQQGMLFHTLYAPQSGVYVEQLSCTITGELNLTAFERAWQRVVERHQTLRTAFIWEGVDKPLQVVRQQIQISCEQLDWRGLPPLKQQAKLKLYLEADRRRGFELARAPLLRLTLIRLGEESYRFIWSYHHLLLDGWSEPLIFKEVIAYYEAFCLGRDLDLDRPRPYRDYVAWLGEQDRARAEMFWRAALKGFAAPTPLAVEQKIDLPEGTDDHAECQLPLSAATTQALYAFARAHRLTPSTVLQGAWALLLGRYSGLSDVVFGLVVSGRPAGLAGVEHMTGLFVNTLPVRVQVRGNEPVRSWLEKLQQQQSELRAYEHSPLVEVQGWSEVERGRPLFESLFVFEKFPLGASLLRKTISLQMYDFVRLAEKTNYPLTVAAIPDQELLLHITYDGRRFESGAIRRLLGHFVTLLEGITTAASDARLDSLPLLTEAERQQLLVDWNDTRADYPRHLCIHQMFEAQAERTPERVALVFEGERMTYRELNRRANKCAHRLRSDGVGPEQVVGILLEPSLEMIISILAVLKAGGAYLPLDPAYPKERLAFMLTDARAQLLLTNRELGRRLSRDKTQMLYMDADSEFTATESTENPESGITAENLAYVIYTSGSTGSPKGVMVAHRGICNHLFWGQQTYPLTETDALLQLCSFSFDTSVWEFFTALTTGARLVLTPSDKRNDSAYLVKQIAEQEITVIGPVPALLKALLNEDGIADCPSLRLVCCGGETLPVELKEEFHARLAAELYNCYGPTEASVDATFRACGRDRKLRTVPIGRPIANTHAYLLDRHLQPVPIGVSGELYLGGTGLARGYLNRPDLTAEKFIPNPFSSEAGARLYRTGDLARFLPSGQIEFLGRTDSQVKVRGYRIELGEIEAALSQHPQVRECAVIARTDRVRGTQLIAYVVVRQGGEASVEAWRSFLREKLPEYMIPARFVELGELPRTVNGKVDRGRLPEVERSRGEEGKGYIGPRSGEEEALAVVWSEVLGVERVGIHDNFFDLGGDSILAIQVISRARKAGLHLTPQQLFRHPTVAELAAIAVAAQAPRAEQGAITGPVPLTPIQQWFFEQEFADPYYYNQAVLLKVDRGLDASILERAAERLLAHHDALRMRFAREDSFWRQTNASAEAQSRIFSYHDLSKLPPAERRAALEKTAAELQASLNLTSGPLARLALFDFGAGEPNRLLIIIHHLVVDGVSWRILLEDLQTAGQQLSGGQRVTLPAKTASFKEWATRLAQWAGSAAAAEEQDYWLSLPWHKATRLPLDKQGDRNSEDEARAVSVSLSRPETEALLKGVPAAWRAHVGDVLLTALLQSFRQWRGEQTLLIDLEGHGREPLFDDVDVSRTVGWFTSVFPVLLEWPEGAGLPAALGAIKQQLRRIPHGGVGYGLLRYTDGASGEETARQLRALPQAEVSFNYLGQVDQVFPPGSLFSPALESGGAARSPRNRRSHLIEIDGLVRDRQLQFVWTYSENFHRAATIERLAAGFTLALQSLIALSRSPQAAVYTASDFPLAQLNQQQLSKVIAKMSNASKPLPK